MMIEGTWVMNRDANRVHFLSDKQEWPFRAVCGRVCKPLPRIKSPVNAKQPVCKLCVRILGNFERDRKASHGTDLPDAERIAFNRMRFLRGTTL